VTNEELCHQWETLKSAEREAVEARRMVEDEIIRRAGIREGDEGTRKFGTLKIACRIDIRVDSDIAQQCAAEHDMTEHLTGLFRWKPELRIREWSGAHETIQRAFSPALTSKPARPSFSIATEKESK